MKRFVQIKGFNADAEYISNKERADVTLNKPYELVASRDGSYFIDDSGEENFGGTHDNGMSVYIFINYYTSREDGQPE